MTTYSYDSKGRVTKVTDPSNRTTEYVYDDAGNVIQVKDSLQNSQSTEYVTRDGITTSLVSKVKDAMNRAVTYSYDAIHDLVTSVSTALGTIHYAYDSRDRQTQATDASGHTTQFVYNDKDQLTSVIEAGNSSTTADDILANFTYNALGQLSNISGPIGAVTKFAYDIAGRMVNTLIGESTKKYSTGESVKIADVGEDIAKLTLTIDSTVSQAKILYKKATDLTYQSITVSNLTAGDNTVTIQGLSSNTIYNFEVQYIDKEGDVSYSRKYDLEHNFQTKTPEIPAVLNTTVQSVADTTASVKINVSKDIRDAQITYHVHGETLNKTIFTQNVSNAKADGLTFDFENLRSGQNYDADITITDRFGVTSEIKSVSFNTTGSLSTEDTAIHTTPDFGQVIATSATQVYISLQIDNSRDPNVDGHCLDIIDSQGNTVSQEFDWCVIGMTESVALVSGLSPDTQYTYILRNTSKDDVLPIFGSFRTSTGSDTTPPEAENIQFKLKDSFDCLLNITPLEALKTLLVTMIDKVNHNVMRYRYFDIPANMVSLFLLDGLEAGRSYAIKWSMIDTSGNVSSIDYSFINFTMPAYDQTPPILTNNTLTERTDTTAELHLITNEQLKSLKVHYRIIGATDWLEQLQNPTTTSFDINLSNLISGQSYEYQYILEDNSGNQFLTGWMGE